MVFKKPGNSREDKSAGSPKRTSRHGEQSGKNSFYKEKNSSSDFKKTDAGSSRPAKRYSDDAAGKKPFASGGNRFSNNQDSAAGRPFKKFDKREDSRPAGHFNAHRDEQGSGQKPFRSRPPADEGGYRKRGDKPAYSSRPAPSGNRDDSSKRTAYGMRDREGADERPYRERQRPSDARPDRVMRGRNKKTDDTQAASKKEDSGLIRLNRYISNAGICSRRKADELISAGVVSVNGQVVSELGHKVDPMRDVIKYNGETLKREKMVYVLLNKPKDYITTTDDPQERRTVMQLVEKASKERIYPVGRLDRNTTGLLLMTNDGDLADKLSHPRNNITKIYQVELNKNLTQGDLNKIGFGLELEDGLIKPDMVTYVAGGTKREIGLQIHSGKNRIVRRIFEHLGYEVVKLDRTVYGNLNKKDLPRGRWRFLEEKELIQLKHLI